MYLPKRYRYRDAHFIAFYKPIANLQSGHLNYRKLWTRDKSLNYVKYKFVFIVIVEQIYLKQKLFNAIAKLISNT